MAEDTDRNVLRTLLADLRDFVRLLIDLVSDDEMAQAAFGFSVDLGLVSHLDVVADTLDAAASGTADLAQFAPAASRLAEVTNAVRLLAQAGDSGLTVEEAAAFVIDTAGLSYLAAKMPNVIFLARTLGLLTENVPVGELLSDVGKSLSSGLETEEDARRASIYLGALGILLALTPPLLQTFFHRTIDPGTLRVLQGWEADPTSLTPVADGISQRFVTFLVRVPERPAPDDDGTIAQQAVEFTLTAALVPKVHGGPGLWLSFGLGADADLRLGSGWHLVVENQILDPIDLFVAGDLGNSFVQGGGAAGVKAEVRLERRDEGTTGSTSGGPTTTPAQPWRLGGVLELTTATLSLKLSDRPPIAQLALRLHDAAIVVPRPDSGFLHDLVPEGGLHAKFDLGLIADSTPRFSVEGGTGLEVMIPVHTSGPTVQGLHIYLALHGRPENQTGGPPVTFEASAGFSLKIGGFTATLDRFGLVLPQAPHGFPGAPWLRFPNTIGLGLDFDGVKGGGFILFDPDHGRYAGMLALTIGDWTISAFGLLTDRDDGYSLLVVFSVEWAPPLPGPFGIGLKGLGGLIGHNHSTNVSVLQASMRTGAVGTILFPADPAAAAPRILTTLGNVFPATTGSSLLGIGLKLTWSDGLVSLVAAVVVESGRTPRIVLLASLDIIAPAPELVILHIRVDAVGVIDTTRPSVEVDGSLVNSWIGPFALTGDGAFRFHGDDGGLFLLAVGGFHPAYTPPASANLPPQRRLTLALPMENPRVRLEQYWALTSNSIQVGARLEVSARKGGFSAEALIGFDALARRDPFHLTVDIEARAAIRYDGTTLASVGLELHLDGPDPWHLWGKAKLELLFFTVSIPIDTTFGDDSPDEPVPAADAAAALAAALADPSNWETTRPLGAAALVTLRPDSTDAGNIAAHPAAVLGVTQHVLPLGVSLTHLGRATVTPDRFVIDAVSSGDTQLTVVDQRAPFAAGEFVELSEDERLSRPSFESFVAGFVASSALTTAGPAVAADLTYEEIIMGPDGPLDDTPPRRAALTFAAEYGAGLGPAAASPLRRSDDLARLRANAQVRLSNATRVVVDDALRPVAVPDAPLDATDTELRQAIAASPTAEPRLVVASYEAAGSG